MQPYDIIIIGNLIPESKNTKDVTAMFTRDAHNKLFCIIFIMQNSFLLAKKRKREA